MEVHHHGHHNGRKNWKTTLFDFFMLFLAVFCGFLAEYQLEHMIEHQKEKEFIHSLLEDLRTDTTQAGTVINYVEQEYQAIDSLLVELSGDGIYQDAGNASMLWKRSMGFADFIYTDRTIQQLKNSGSLRLIRNGNVSNAIMKYDGVVRMILIHQDIMNQLIASNTLNFRLFDLIKAKKNPMAPLSLTNDGKQLLNEAYANRLMWKSYLRVLVFRAAQVKEEATQLIGHINQQYKL